MHRQRLLKELICLSMVSPYARPYVIEDSLFSKQTFKGSAMILELDRRQTFLASSFIGLWILARVGIGLLKTRLSGSEFTSVLHKKFLWSKTATIELWALSDAFENGARAFG